MQYLALMLHGAGFRHGLRAEIAAEGSVRYAIDARVAGTSAVSRSSAARGCMPIRYARSERRPERYPVGPS